MVSTVESELRLTVNTVESELMLTISILKRTANRSPYIFTLVQKVKHRVYKIHVF